jgi:hypothetical protein
MLDWLRERRDDVIGFREIVQFGPAPVLTKSAAEEALSILMMHGWVVEASARPRKLRLMGRYDFPWLIATSYRRIAFHPCYSCYVCYGSSR